jgi:hypothetical protein
MTNDKHAEDVATEADKSENEGSVYWIILAVKYIICNTLLCIKWLLYMLIYECQQLNDLRTP